ncbi:MAG: energy-coupling factor transporter transmembrane protein EcfT [Lachnospiraceae bacterium]|nr:energy-coupling factor transporter transmembrane protein EcfT [Lachnospiraceae bacterium]
MSEQSIQQKIEQNLFPGTANLDPRCKLLLLIFLGFFSYMIVGDVTGLLLMVVFGFLVAAGGDGKWAVKMLVAYVVVAYLNTRLKYVTIPGLSVIMSVFGVTILKFIPIIMVGRWVLRTTCMDDLMVSLERAKFPREITIAFVVMFRYIPTLKIEHGMIRNTMKIRGIVDTFWKKLLHPLSTMEYILVPLLMRCLKVTEELAASGTTRGLERENVRYSLRPVRFGWKEVAVAAGGFLVLFTLYVLDHTAVGAVVIWR